MDCIQVQSAQYIPVLSEQMRAYHPANVTDRLSPSGATFSRVEHRQRIKRDRTLLQITLYLKCAMQSRTL